MTDNTAVASAVSGLTDGTGDVRLAYLAGFFDGEGCIHVGRTIQSRSRDRRNHRPQSTARRRYFRLSVTVAQNDPRPLQELVERFGGTLHRFASRRAFVWMLNGPQARYALQALLPHLRVKRGEAELALLFQSWLTKRRGARALTPWEIAERESVVEAMGECKRLTFDLEGANA